MFTHLHCHSYYSFSSGTIPADELPLLAKKNGMNAVALTDTNNITGAIEFYISAKKAGIKPVIGIELLNKNERVILLAKNTDGYREICDTTTEVLKAIPQTKQKITYDSIIQDKIIDALPVISNSNNNKASLLPFLHNLTEDVIIITSNPLFLEKLSERKHPNIYLELIPSERHNWRQLRDIHKRHKLALLAANNAVMANKGDYLTHKTLKAIGMNTNLGLLPKNTLSDPSQYFANEQEMRKMLSGVSEEAFSNINKIVDQCNVEFDFSQPKFAKYPCENPVEMLRGLSEKGLFNRFPNPSVDHIKRFSYELDMINNLGATSYFLAVKDMIEYSKQKNFPYLARGSGANSFIAYCLDISNVDPIENNLRFERFLNPERLVPPDFDIDYSWKNRYDVINYMLDKYGRDRSAMLCTIQTYKSKGAIREIGKAFGFGDAEIKNFYTRLRELHFADESTNYGIEELSNNKDNKNSKHLDDFSQWILEANKIMGFPRHLSVHAGGVIIADKPISNYCPTQIAPIGIPIMQQNMFSAEDWKLIKLDVLATRGLGVYWDTMNLVEKRTGIRPPVGDVRIALNDEKTKELIREGKTKGCFYIESPAMQNLLKKLRVGSFKMLTAASSIIRPGVASSGMMQEFIERHHDPSRRKYAHPKIGEILSETYGIMIYQEDVLNVVHELAGLSYGQADLFRRAMSGKLRSKESLDQHKKAFIDGCIKNGLTKDISDELWRQISSFSGYSFCKAHSASYAVLSFQEAWLKRKYPAEFLCSVLNNYGGFYSHQEYVNECKILDVEVALPCINRSSLEHTVEQDHVIRIGLEGIKEVSAISKQNLLKNRELGGRYLSIEDFILRSGITAEDGRILISLGACDCFGKRREEVQILFASLIHGRSTSISQKGRRMNSKSGSQSILELENTLIHFNLDHLSESSAYFDFLLEKRYLGYSVSNHPCDFISENKDTVSAEELPHYKNRKVNVQGYIASTKFAKTKKGDTMAMINLAGREGMVDIIVWPDQFKKFYSVITSAQALQIYGKVQESFGAFSLIAEKIEKVDFREH